MKIKKGWLILESGRIWQFRTYRPEETAGLAALLGEYAGEGACLTLQGEMGAGKTLFAQGFARGLGVEEYVTSPTFALANQYASGRLPFVHMDLYRLESQEEVYQRGLEDFFDGRAVTLVEWPEVMEGLLPEKRLAVRIAKYYDQEANGQWRSIELEPLGELAWLEEALKRCEIFIS